MAKQQRFTKKIKLFEYPFVRYIKQYLGAESNGWQQSGNNLNRFFNNQGRVLIVYSQHIHYFNDGEDISKMTKISLPLGVDMNQIAQDVVKQINTEWNEQDSNFIPTLITQDSFDVINKGYKFPFELDQYGHLILDVNGKHVLDVRGHGHMKYIFDHYQDIHDTQNKLGFVIVELLNKNARRFGFK